MTGQYDKYRDVAMMFHTIDLGLPKVGNVIYTEIPIELFNELSKQEFMRQAMANAEQFWNQMARGRIRRNRYRKWPINNSLT